MTLSELISQLQELADQHGGDAEVRLATQPNYPLESSVSGVAVRYPGVVYVLEGSQLGYASRSLWSDPEGLGGEDDPV